MSFTKAIDKKVPSPVRHCRAIRVSNGASRSELLSFLKEKLPSVQCATFEDAPTPELEFLAQCNELLEFCSKSQNGVRALKYHLDEIGRSENGLKTITDCCKHSLSGTKLLDVGCGYGGLLVAAARRNITAYGVEIDSCRVEGARQRLRAWGLESNPLLGSALEIPFGSNTFDIVTCQDVFDHLPAHERAMSEIYRVLAPGGYAWVQTCTKFTCMRRDPHHGLFGVSLLAAPVAARYVTWIRHRIAHPCDYRACAFPTYSGLMKIFRRLGFSIVYGEDPLIIKAGCPEKIVHNHFARRAVRIAAQLKLTPLLKAMLTVRAEFKHWFSVVCRKP